MSLKSWNPITIMMRAFQPLYSSKFDFTLTARNMVDCDKIVASLSTGNILLQLGKFSTEEDINARKEAVCNFDFSDK